MTTPSWAYQNHILNDLNFISIRIYQYHQILSGNVIRDRTLDAAFSDFCTNEKGSHIVN